jgi:hypothetical protein
MKWVKKKKQIKQNNNNKKTKQNKTKSTNFILKQAQILIVLVSKYGPSLFLI